MTRVIGTFLFALVSSLACAQSLQPERTQCLREIVNTHGVWSPDCRSYFVSGTSLLGIAKVEVYTIRGKTTYVNSAVEEIRCDLALESLGHFSIQFHDVKWVDSDQLRLDVRLLDSSGASHAEYRYLVNAHTGQVLETTFPTRRNWNCSTSPRATGGPAI